ncbi:uncharacterized protein B0H18DRAFT_1015256, partial [Fomitopsis serialis]|uniref:uncharacterized protein n=1 Tax=Fomitopsis serialis TaxID=139415 RepID=UPI0020075986
GPGLFNALDGLGGGGEISSAIYATFAFTAFFAGSINNVVGPRLTLLIGSSGYAVYIGSYLCILPASLTDRPDELSTAPSILTLMPAAS